MLYKTHKNDNPLELLSVGSNTAVCYILKVTFNVNMNEKKKNSRITKLDLILFQHVDGSTKT